MKIQNSREGVIFLVAVANSTIIFVHHVDCQFAFSLAAFYTLYDAVDALYLHKHDNERFRVLQ